MIIRIGDEKRDLLDEHLRKLKQQILSEEAQRNCRDCILETLIKCVTFLPHKTMVYSALVGMIAVESEIFT